MPVLKRFRALFTKVAGSLGRPDSAQPNKVRSTLWHQRSHAHTQAHMHTQSQASSRASSPSTSSLVGSTASEPVLSSAAPEPASMSVDGVTEVNSRAEASEQDASSEDEAPKDHDQEQEPSPNPESTDISSATENNVSRPRSNSSAIGDTKVAAQIVYTAPLDTPPTPKSFNDVPRLASSSSACEEEKEEEFSDHVPLSRLSATTSEHAVPDAHVLSLTKPKDRNGLPYPQLSTPFIDSLAMPASPVTPNERATTSSSQNSQGSGVFSANRVSSETNMLGYSTPGYQKYSTGRPIERPFTSISSSIRKSRASMISSLASPPVPPEVARMLEEITEHRKTTAELAESSGIMGPKYFECLRGYTSIQEPSNSYWKRRYFVVADQTLFLYTNECSRTPNDHWLLTSVVRAPRKADDDVLMPHAVAVDFGTGEHYLFFDTAAIRQAFEKQVLQAIGLGVAAGA
ncbi:hypothetical protein H4R99_004944 [Coemansia sp. RSA 1722]|nr:hypothetical protein H4R99_004944 [Coemansia sp. RSA 1722]